LYINNNNSSVDDDYINNNNNNNNNNNRHLVSKQQTNGAHTECVYEDVAVFWNQGVYTEREFTSNRPDIIIKNKS
jgi:hypothetical protein